jgi:hypothetical protein
MAEREAAHFFFCPGKNNNSFKGRAADGELIEVNLRLACSSPWAYKKSENHEKLLGSPFPP